MASIVYNHGLVTITQTHGADAKDLEELSVLLEGKTITQVKLNVHPADKDDVQSPRKVLTFRVI